MQKLKITFLLTLSTPLLHAQWALVDDMETDNNWIGTGLFGPDPDDATTAGTASFQGGTFRNGTADDLITLLTFNNEANTISYLDDVFLDLSGENLTHTLRQGR